MTVCRDLMSALRKKRLYIADQIGNVVLYQDNATSQTTRNTLLEIDVSGFQQAIHPPYSPDLVLLDFAYFPMLKSYLGETLFNDRSEICHAIQTLNHH